MYCTIAIIIYFMCVADGIHSPRHADSLLVAVVVMLRVEIVRSELSSVVRAQSRAHCTGAQFVYCGANSIDNSLR
jgi:hypothetical protein